MKNTILPIGFIILLMEYIYELLEYLNHFLTLNKYIKMI